MRAAGTTQMNVRIDSTLKREGDEALASAGISPTEAVRALWERVVLERRDPARVREIVTGAPAGAEPRDEGASAGSLEGRDPAFARAMDVQRRIEARMKSLGVDVARPWDGPSDDELLEEYMFERYFGGECGDE